MISSPSKTFADATGTGQFRFPLNRIRSLAPFVCLMVLTLLHTLSAAAASEGVISVQFVGAGTAMASSETAGVIAKANWNQAAGAASGATPLSLVDENGTPTGATASWVADDVSANSNTDSPGNGRMLRGYLDTGNGNPSTLMVSGLAPGKYVVYLYSNGQTNASSTSATYQIGGPGVAETGIGAGEAGFDGTFLQATNTPGNYVVFKDVTVISGFTVTATPSLSASGVLSAPVNGLQIVPAGADPDFSMVVVPATETVTDGGTAVYIVRIQALNGFTGTVNLALSPEGAPPGGTESVKPAVVTGSGSAIITIKTAAGMSVSGETQPIIGTSGSLSHGAEFSTTYNPAPGFSLGVNPFSQSMTAGGSATYSASIYALNGFTGDVHLVVSGLPAGATASFSAPSLHAAGVSTLTVHTTAATPTGVFSLTLTATSGVLTQTASLSLTVGSAPDFSLSAGPGTQTLTGSTVKYLIDVGALSGFTGTVNLTVSGLPANAAASFSPPSLTGSAISVLTITTSGAIPSGASTLTITGASGSLSHAVTVTLVAGTAPDFSVSVLSPPETFPGEPETFTVTVGGLNGFSGTVNLSANGPPGVTTESTFRPASISAFPGGSTLTLSVLSPPGSNFGTPVTVTITATSGALSHSVAVTIVPSVSLGFEVFGSPNSQTVTSGTTATYPIVIEDIGGPGHFSGSVNLTVTGLPAGATASFEDPTPYIVGFASQFEIYTLLNVITTPGTPAGSYPLTVTGTSGTISQTNTLTLTVFKPGTQPVISVDFVGSGTPMAPSESAGVVAKANWNEATGATSSMPVSLVDQTGSATGGTLTWTSDNVWSLPIADSPGNFRMMRGYLDNGSGHPTTVTVSGIAPAAYDIYVYTDGDNGSVSRTGIYQLSPAGQGLPSSISATDPANTNFSGTFVQANNSNGNYVLFSGVVLGQGIPLLSGPPPAGFTLTATPDGASRAPVNGLQIVLSQGPSPDFDVSSAQTSQTVVPGGAVTYLVNLTPVNGFNGPVSLSAFGSLTTFVNGSKAVPAFPEGVTASFNPSVVPSLPATSVLTVTTTGATPVGGTSVIVSAASGSLTNTTTLGLVVGPAGGTTVTSIDFVGSGTAMARSEAAGVLIRENWNDAVGGKSSSALPLVDENGSRSGATVTWGADDVQNTTIADLAGNFRMMRGYLDTGSGNPTTVTVSGLATGTYSIYVYVDGNNSGAMDTATYQISGPGILTSSATATDAANTDFGGTFIQADNGTGNYIVFSNVAVTSGFTLTATAVAPGGSAPVNGIQIVH